MKNPNADIYEMLDTLSLPVAAQRFMELSKSPELFFASLFCINLQKVFVGCCTYIL